MERVNYPDTDIAFKLTFPKAREWTPDNRPDFQPVIIKVVDDAWIYEPDNSPAGRKGKQSANDRALQLLREEAAGIGDRRHDELNGQMRVFLETSLARHLTSCSIPAYLETREAPTIARNCPTISTTDKRATQRRPPKWRGGGGWDAHGRVWRWPWP